MARHRPHAGALVLAGLLGAGASLCASSQSPNAGAHQVLTGTWRLDETASKEHETNWNRPWRPPPETGCLPGVPPRDGMRAPLPKCPGPVITYDSRATGTLTGFGRTLIAQSKQFVIQVSPPASVTIASDFLEATRYSTSGDTDTIRVDLGFGARQPYFERVKVRTGWRETSLVQTLSSETGGVGFKMTRTFLPTADGRQLFLIIQVLAPTLKPPVADITRTYVRLHTP